MTYIQEHKTKSLRDFGRSLTSYRQALGMSRINLANKVNVTQEHIWRLENGFRGCSRDLTIILGQILSLNLEQINELLVLAGHRPMIKKGGFSEDRLTHTGR